MSGEVAARENSWSGDEENNEVNAGTNSWSDDENEAPPSAGTGAPTPVRVDKGGNSAPPSTRVKKMPKGNLWNAERPAPEPKSEKVGASTIWVPVGKKGTASVAPAAPAPGGAPVPMTPKPLPKEHKSILSPGGNASGPVSRFNLGSPGSPNTRGGSRKTRKTKSRKFRAKKAKKSRKNQRTRRSRR